MNLLLEKKTVLVTGSTKGIGFAIAHLLKAEGASVIVNGRSEDGVRRAVEKINGSTRGIVADVSTATGCEALAANARLIVACEPVRRRHFQWLFAALCALVGANHVSRHDGRVSIEAGFLGDELPALLGLDPKVWHWRVTTTGRGMYQMVAERCPT